MAAKKFSLYMHTAPNGKVYIGITGRKPEARWGEGGCGYKSNVLFWRAIQKYGWENIKHEVLCSGLSREEASSREVEYIERYNSNNPSYGYNCTSGGEVGYVITSADTLAIMSKNGKRNWLRLSEEERRKKVEELRSGAIRNWQNPDFREKMRKVCSENGKKAMGHPAYNRGVPMSEETRIKVSGSKKGQHWTLTDETKAKMRKPKSEETRRKMSESKKKMFANMTPEQREAYCARKKIEYERYKQKEVI